MEVTCDTHSSIHEIRVKLPSGLLSGEMNVHIDMVWLKTLILSPSGSLLQIKLYYISNI